MNMAIQISWHICNLCFGDFWSISSVGIFTSCSSIQPWNSPDKLSSKSWPGLTLLSFGAQIRLARSCYLPVSYFNRRHFIGSEWRLKSRWSPDSLYYISCYSQPAYNNERLWPIHLKVTRLRMPNDSPWLTTISLMPVLSYNGAEKKWLTVSPAINNQPNIPTVMWSKWLQLNERPHCSVMEVLVPLVVHNLRTTCSTFKSVRATVWERADVSQTHSASF